MRPKKKLFLDWLKTSWEKEQKLITSVCGVFITHCLRRVLSRARQNLSMYAKWITVQFSLSAGELDKNLS